jgi:CheY-like chemotaxis protein
MSDPSNPSSNSGPANPGPPNPGPAAASPLVDTRRILLVEDSPNDVELTLTALAEHRLANEVVVVSDGEQALSYLHREGNYKMRAEGNPVVVLLDIKLPKVDGLEVLQRMRSHPKLRTVPVVMLTSSREEQDIVRSYNLGVNAYVVKPVDFSNFIRAITELGLFWAVINQPPPLTQTPGA